MNSDCAVEPCALPEAPFPLTLTPAAVDKLIDLLAYERDKKFLRVSVQGGGCAGYAYALAFEAQPEPDDLQATLGGVPVLVDAFSAPLLAGGTLDYEEGLMASQFRIHNPHAQTTCGCGSSFSI